MSKTYYITTPLYYPSGNLHIGHTYTTIAADVLARYKREQGYEVKFLTGTDEHGEKIEKVAKENNVTPKEYVDGIVKSIKELWEVLEITNDIFIRTTDDYHEEVVRKIFTKLYEKGDIYKGHYEGYYCTPCEAYWTETQLEEGKCPDCGREVYMAKEEAYFFKLSKYQDKLMELIEENKEFLKPENRAKEMINNFLKPGLQDLCISRTNLDWGIRVPFDKEHTIYVWFDAVCNYISGLGYSLENEEDFKKFWPADVHFVGKEIVRFHTIIWPAMLMALDVEVPKTVFAHGWILFDNDKMSKSKGNVIYPEPLIKLYGIDALKYFLLREFSFGQDGSFTREKFLNRTNADLANDLGNLVSRTVAMIEKYNDAKMPSAKTKTDFDDSLIELAVSTKEEVELALDKLDYSGALDRIWKLISRTNKYIDETMPWALAKEPEKKDVLDTVLYNLSESIRIVSILIRPFIHHTSESIVSQLGLEKEEWDKAGTWGLTKEGANVKKASPMFPRLDVKKELEKIEAENKALIESRNPKKAEEKQEEELEGVITIDDFTKVELVVAKVLEAKPHPDADRLLVLQLDAGKEKRQVVSGISKWYSPEDLIGKNVVLVANLKPVKLRGVESQGMVLAASKGKKLTLVTIMDEMKPGTKIS